MNKEISIKWFKRAKKIFNSIIEKYKGLKELEDMEETEEMES
jgi:hypothetical protein